MAPHPFRATVHWTGNLGTGTSSYTAYARDHEIAGVGKIAPIPGSSDPAFRGAADRYTPEELLAASLASCHMLWFLHLAAERGVVVVGYDDAPEGVMETERATGGRITEVTLRPRVTVAAATDAPLAALHEEAHRKCFVANSVRFPVRVAPEPVAIASA